MEFLLQMIADLIGTPAEDESVRQDVTKEKETDIKAAPVAEETKEEEPVLFGLMQFH